MKTKKYPAALRSFSFLLALLFTWNTIAWSAPFEKPASFAPTFEKLIASLEIPKEWGTVEESFVPAKVSSSAPVIIHIRDAHSQPEAQRNIEKILQFLSADKKINSVAIEASFGKTDVSFLNLLPNPEANTAMKDALVNMGELSGADLFASNERNSNVYGVEDKAFYKESLEIFKRLKSSKAEIQAVLRKHQIALEEEEARFLPEELRNYVIKKRAWENSHDISTDYFFMLGALHKKQFNEDLSDARNQDKWPHMLRLLKISEIEHELNLEKARQESAGLAKVFPGYFAEGLQVLSQNGQMLEGWLKENPYQGSGETRRFFEGLWKQAREQKIALVAYPEFLKLGGLVILRQELQPGLLFKETALIEKGIEEKMFSSPGQKRILQAGKDLSLAGKALSLQMGRDDYEDFLERKSEFSGQFPEEFLKDAERFYELSVKRDHALIENTLRVAKKNPTALIAGGFHSEGLTRLLKEKNIPYVTVQPKMNHVADETLYEKVMLGSNVDSKSLPAGSSTLGALGWGSKSYNEIGDPEKRGTLLSVVLSSEGIPALRKQNWPEPRISTTVRKAIAAYPDIFERPELRLDLPETTSAPRSELREIGRRGFFGGVLAIAFLLISLFFPSDASGAEVKLDAPSKELSNGLFTGLGKLRNPKTQLLAASDKDTGIRSADLGFSFTSLTLRYLNSPTAAGKKASLTSLHTAIRTYLRLVADFGLKINGKGEAGYGYDFDQGPKGVKTGILPARFVKRFDYYNVQSKDGDIAYSASEMADTHLRLIYVKAIIEEELKDKTKSPNQKILTDILKDLDEILGTGEYVRFTKITYQPFVDGDGKFHQEMLVSDMNVKKVAPPRLSSKLIANKYTAQPFIVLNAMGYLGAGKKKEARVLAGEKVLETMKLEWGAMPVDKEDPLPVLKGDGDGALTEQQVYALILFNGKVKEFAPGTFWLSTENLGKSRKSVVPALVTLDQALLRTLTLSEAEAAKDIRALVALMKKGGGKVVEPQDSYNSKTGRPVKGYSAAGLGRSLEALHQKQWPEIAEVNGFLKKTGAKMDKDYPAPKGLTSRSELRVIDRALIPDEQKQKIEAVEARIARKLGREFKFSFAGFKHDEQHFNTAMQLIDRAATSITLARVKEDIVLSEFEERDGRTVKTGRKFPLSGIIFYAGSDESSRFEFADEDGEQRVILSRAGVPAVDGRLAVDITLGNIEGKDGIAGKMLRALNNSRSELRSAEVPAEYAPYANFARALTQLKIERDGDLVAKLRDLVGGSQVDALRISDYAKRINHTGLEKSLVGLKFLAGSYDVQRNPKHAPFLAVYKLAQEAGLLDSTGYLSQVRRAHFSETIFELGPQDVEQIQKFRGLLFQAKRQGNGVAAILGNEKNGNWKQIESKNPEVVLGAIKRIAANPEAGTVFYTVALEGGLLDQDGFLKPAERKLQAARSELRSMLGSVKFWVGAAALVVGLTLTTLGAVRLSKPAPVERPAAVSIQEVWPRIKTVDNTKGKRVFGDSPNPEITHAMDRGFRRLVKFPAGNYRARFESITTVIAANARPVNGEEAVTLSFVTRAGDLEIAPFTVRLGDSLEADTRNLFQHITNTTAEEEAFGFSGPVLLWGGLGVLSALSLAWFLGYRPFPVEIEKDDKDAKKGPTGKRPSRKRSELRATAQTPYDEMQALNRAWIRSMIPAGGVTLEDGTHVTAITDPNDLPEKIRGRWNEHSALVIAKNEKLGYSAFIGLHHVLPRLNPSTQRDEFSGAIGGIRRLKWPNQNAAIADALLLSYAMTDKLALYGEVPGGGTKTMFDFDPNAPADLADLAYKSLGRVLQRFPMTFVGQDMNTSTENLLSVGSTAPDYVVGDERLPLKGAPSFKWTALGVEAGMEQAAKVKFGEDWSFQGKLISIQGAGNVGRTLIDSLLAKGARIVVSEAANKREALLASLRKVHGTKVYEIKNAGDFNAAWPKGSVAVLENPDDIYDVPADVFSPNAFQFILNKGNIVRLKAAGVQVVAGAANDQLETPEDAQRLVDAGILYATDYGINAGGFTGVLKELYNLTQNGVTRAIATTIRKISEEAVRRKVSPALIAKERAKANLERFDRGLLKRARAIQARSEMRSAFQDRRLFNAAALTAGAAFVSGSASVFSQEAGKGRRFYVSSSKGNDGNAGSEARPFKTLKNALSRLQPGDTLVIGRGVYSEAVRMPRSGKAGAVITVRAENGAVFEGKELVKEKAYDVIRDNADLDEKFKALVRKEFGDKARYHYAPAFDTNGQSYLRFENLTINRMAGISIKGGSNVEIKGLRGDGNYHAVGIYDAQDVSIEDLNTKNNWNGIQINGAKTRAVSVKNSIIASSRDVFKDMKDAYTQGDGITINAGENITIDGLVALGHWDAAVDNKGNNVRILNSVFGGNKSGFKAWGSGMTVENSLIYGGVSQTVPRQIEGNGITTQRRKIGVRVLNSTIVDNENYAIRINPTDGRFEIVNSVIATRLGKSRGLLENVGGDKSAFVARNNVWFQTGRRAPAYLDASDLWADPGFEDWAKGDYRLKESGAAFKKKAGARIPANVLKLWEEAKSLRSELRSVAKESSVLVKKIAAGNRLETLLRPYLSETPAITSQQIKDAETEIIAAFKLAQKTVAPEFHEILYRAFALAVVLHADQPRASKGDSRPYMIHVAGVVRLLIEKFGLTEQIKDPTQIADAVFAAFLHDTYEDGKKGRWGKKRFEELKALEENEKERDAKLREEIARLITGQVNANVAGIVMALSKPNYDGMGLTDEMAIEAQYYIDLAKAPLATQLIKAADFSFNLGDLKYSDDRKFPRKFFLKRLGPVLGFLPGALISNEAKAMLVRSIRQSAAENQTANDQKIEEGKASRDDAPAVLTEEQEALLAKAEADYGSSVFLLIKTLRSSQPTLRLVAAKALTDLGLAALIAVPEIIAAIRTGMKIPSGRTLEEWRELEKTLLGMGQPAKEMLLKAALEPDQNHTVRFKIYSILKKTGLSTEEELSILRLLLRFSSWSFEGLSFAESQKTSEEIHHALAELGAAAAPIIPFMIGAEEDSVPDYRLAYIGKPAIPYLLAAYKTKSPDGKRAIINIFKEIKAFEPEEIELLAHEVRTSENQDLRSDVKTTLVHLAAISEKALIESIALAKEGLLTWQDDLQVLEDVLYKGGPSELGPAAAKALIEVITSADKKMLRFRRNAVMTLVKMGPAAKQAVPAIQRIIDDESENEGTRVYAMYALSSILKPRSEMRTGMEALKAALQQVSRLDDTQYFDDPTAKSFYAFALLLAGNDASKVEEARAKLRDANFFGPSGGYTGWYTNSSTLVAASTAAYLLAQGNIEKLRELQKQLEAPGVFKDYERSADFSVQKATLVLALLLSEGNLDKLKAAQELAQKDVMDPMPDFRFDRNVEKAGFTAALLVPGADVQAVKSAKGIIAEKNLFTPSFIHTYSQIAVNTLALLWASQPRSELRSGTEGAPEPEVKSVEDIIPALRKLIHRRYRVVSGPTIRMHTEIGVEETSTRFARYQEESFPRAESIRFVPELRKQVRQGLRYGVRKLEEWFPAASILKGFNQNRAGFLKLLNFFAEVQSLRDHVEVRTEEAFSFGVFNIPALRVLLEEDPAKLGDLLSELILQQTSYKKLAEKHPAYFELPYGGKTSDEMTRELARKAASELPGKIEKMREKSRWRSRIDSGLTAGFIETVLRWLVSKDEDPEGQILRYAGRFESEPYSFFAAMSLAQRQKWDLAQITPENWWVAKINPLDPQHFDPPLYAQFVFVEFLRRKGMAGRKITNDERETQYHEFYESYDGNGFPRRSEMRLEEVEIKFKDWVVSYGYDAEEWVWGLGHRGSDEWLIASPKLTLKQIRKIAASFRRHAPGIYEAVKKEKGYDIFKWDDNADDPLEQWRADHEDFISGVMDRVFIELYDQLPAELVLNAGLIPSFYDQTETSEYLQSLEARLAELKALGASSAMLDGLFLKGSTFIFRKVMADLYQESKVLDALKNLSRLHVSVSHQALTMIAKMALESPSEPVRTAAKKAVSVIYTELMLRSEMRSFVGRPAMPVSIQNLLKDEKLKVLRDFVERVKKEIVTPGSGNLPRVITFSDQHGGNKKFDTLILDAIRGVLPENTIPAGFQLDQDKPLFGEQGQLTSFGITPETLRGKIFFHNIGDLMDRGPFGVKVFRRSKELIDTGLSDFIIGNHDLWESLNLWGFHLPWYEGFKFNGYSDRYDKLDLSLKVENLVRNAHTEIPETFGEDAKLWWAKRLAEYIEFYAQLQKKEWGKRYEEKVNGDFDPQDKAKRVPGTGLNALVEDLFKEDKGRKKEEQLYKPYRDEWNKFRGRNIADTEIYTGVRSVGTVSVQWWVELLASFKKLRDEDKEKFAAQPEGLKTAWNNAIDMMEKEILPEVTALLDKKLKEIDSENGKDKWWWRVFEAINYKNYTSVEWWAKDWSSHKDWGTAVLDELNLDIADPAHKLNQANYLANADLKSVAQFFRQNFNLYIRDIYGNVYLHAFLPVDSKTGEFYFKYRGVEYRGKGNPDKGLPSVWDGLNKLGEDVRNPRLSPLDLYEALNLVNTWYADNTTIAKASHVADAFKKFGLDKLGEVNGFNRLVNGHIPPPDYYKLVKPGQDVIITGFNTGAGKKRFLNSDMGLADKFGSRGGYISTGADLYLRGYTHKGATEITDNPHTLSDDGSKILFENKPIGRDEFLPLLEEELKAEIELLELEMQRSEMRQLKTVGLQVKAPFSFTEVVQENVPGLRGIKDKGLLLEAAEARQLEVSVAWTGRPIKADLRMNLNPQGKGLIGDAGRTATVTLKYAETDQDKKDAETLLDGINTVAELMFVRLNRPAVPIGPKMLEGLLKHNQLDLIAQSSGEIVEHFLRITLKKEGIEDKESILVPVAGERKVSEYPVKLSTNPVERKKQSELMLALWLLNAGELKRDSQSADLGEKMLKLYQALIVPRSEIRPVSREEIPADLRSLIETHEKQIGDLFGRKFEFKFGGFEFNEENTGKVKNLIPRIMEWIRYAMKDGDTDLQLREMVEGKAPSYRVTTTENEFPMTGILFYKDGKNTIGAFENWSEDGKTVYFPTKSKFWTVRGTLAINLAPERIGEFKINILEGLLTGAAASRSEVRWPEIEQKLNENKLDEAARLFTLGRADLEAGQIKEYTRRMDEKYKGPIAIVGKLGGTSISFEIANEHGLLGRRVGKKTIQLGSTEKAFAAGIVNLLAEIIEVYGADRLTHVYFTAPGFFNADGTLSDDQSNLPLQKGFSFTKSVGELLNKKYSRDAKLGKIPVVVVHDGTGGALGEASVFGGQPGAKDLFYLIAGTGIGTRRMINGQPFLGGDRVHNLHNEGPHSLVFNGKPHEPDYEYVALDTQGHHPDFKNPKLEDGSPNPLHGKEDLEDRTSGKAIARYAKQVVEKYQDLDDERGGYARLVRLAVNGDFTHEDTGKIIGDLAKSGNSVAREIIEDRAYELGIGMAVFMLESNKNWPDEFTMPEYFIIGSGLSQIGDIFLNAFRKGFGFRFAQAGRTADLEKIQLSLSKIKDDTAREFYGGLPTPAQIAEHAEKLSRSELRSADTDVQKLEAALQGRGLEEIFGVASALSRRILATTDLGLLWPHARKVFGYAGTGGASLTSAFTASFAAPAAVASPRFAVSSRKNVAPRVVVLLGDTGLTEGDLQSMQLAPDSKVFVVDSQGAIFNNYANLRLGEKGNIRPSRLPLSEAGVYEGLQKLFKKFPESMPMLVLPPGTPHAVLGSYEKIANREGFVLAAPNGAAPRYALFSMTGRIEPERLRHQLPEALVAFNYASDALSPVSIQPGAENRFAQWASAAMAQKRLEFSA